MKSGNIVNALIICAWLGILGAIALFFTYVGEELLLAITYSVSSLIGSIILFAIADIVDSLQGICNNTAEIYKQNLEKMAK